MQFRFHNQGLRAWLRHHAPDPVLTLLSIVLAALAFLFHILLPPGTAVPALSMLTVAIAFLIAGAAWTFAMRRNTDTVNCWDVAGGLMLIGLSTALLVPDTAMMWLVQ